MVWTKFSRVWSTSSWCEQNYDGVIFKIDGVNNFFLVWSNVDGVIKLYFGVNKRPFFGNCVITPYGVMSSHVFSWWRGFPGSSLSGTLCELRGLCRHSYLGPRTCDGSEKPRSSKWAGSQSGFPLSPLYVHFRKNSFRFQVNTVKKS